MQSETDPVVPPANRRIQDYERHWQRYADAAKDLIDGVETDIATVTRKLRQMPDPIDILDDILADYYAGMDIEKDSDGRLKFALWVIEGQYQLMPRGGNDEHDADLLVEAVLASVTDETDAIVETGSGYGRNLFEIYLRCGRPNLRLVACEPTASGRATTETVFSLDPAVALSTHTFDNDEPDFGFLADQPDVVLFTCNSLENAIHLNPAYFDRLLESTGRCTGIHLEPVGWQRIAMLCDQAEDAVRHNKWCFDVKEFDVVKGLVLANACRWSVNHRYNIDFLRVLGSFEKAGKLSVRSVQYDVFGSNPFAPASLIAWEKAM